MACFDKLTKNLSPDCSRLTRTGYTGRVALYQYSISDVIVSFDSPAVISEIYTGTKKIKKIYDVELVEPLQGTGVAGNVDSGIPRFQKNLQLNIPDILFDNSEHDILPLTLDTKGYLAVLERRDGGFVVFGALSPLVADLGSFSKNEYENGGSFIVTLTCQENIPEVYYIGDNLFE